MTENPHGPGAAQVWPGLFNRRHDPGRYRTLDRDSNPDHHLFLDLNDVPVNRPRDSNCTEGTS